MSYLAKAFKGTPVAATGNYLPPDQKNRTLTRGVHPAFSGKDAVFH